MGELPHAGLLRLGTLMKYMPQPVITGFTAGIGVVLAGSNFGPEPTHQVPCSTTM